VGRGYQPDVGNCQRFDLHALSPSASSISTHPNRLPTRLPDRSDVFGNHVRTLHKMADAAAMQDS
jgi:hypothetical protein